MPSAANVKVDQPVPSEKNEPPANDSAQSQTHPPIKQALIVIEHKIRNLEKRKARLQTYRDLQSSGKDLNQDQRIAVAKYDEVVQTLDFARDLCKQFQNIALTAEREAKKSLKKDTAVKSQNELVKIREVLLVQDALIVMGQDSVREDFLHGKNGAPVLTESDLKLLDSFYLEVTPKHDGSSEVPFTVQVQTASEHLLAVVDGRQKEAFGSTYSYIKEIIGKIHESGYFDQADINTPAPELVVEEVSQEVISETAPVEPFQPPETIEPEIIQPVVPPQPPIIEQPPYYQQPPPQPQPQPPIAEVLAGGSFFFLQESEIEEQAGQPVPVMNSPPSAIPSQTFTNPNFPNMHDAIAKQQPPPPAAAHMYPQNVNPPPPIPMPPTHQQPPAPVEYAPPPASSMIPTTMGYPAYQQQQPPPPLQQVSTPQPQQHITKEEHRPSNNSNSFEETVESNRFGSGDENRNPRTTNKHNNPNRNNQQPRRNQNFQGNPGGGAFFQNNNGYSNSGFKGGPRPGRGGGTNKPSGSRHQNPGQGNKNKPMQ